MDSHMSQPGPSQVTAEQLQQLLANMANMSVGAPQPKEKLPKLVEYEGAREEWENWKLAAHSKIGVDGNAIGEPQNQMLYLHSRLRGKAANMVRAFIQNKVTAGDGTPEKLLAYMESIYGDPDKVERALAQLHVLRQRENEPFAEFLPKFETLLSEGGGSEFPNAVQVAYLKAALNEEMKRTLVGFILPKEYGAFVARLQDVGSQLARCKPARNTQTHRPKPGGNGNNGNSGGSNSNNPAEAMDWEPTKVSKERKFVDNCGCRGLHTCGRKHAKWVSLKAMAYRRDNGLCLRCGNKGHRIKECQFLAPIRPAQGNKTKTDEAVANVAVDLKEAEAEELD